MAGCLLKQALEYAQLIGLVKSHTTFRPVAQRATGPIWGVPCWPVLSLFQCKASAQSRAEVSNWHVL